jgi:hypothetical protein
VSAWIPLRVFFISWIIVMFLFLVLGRAALALKIPAWAQSLPPWLRGFGAILALYGWTIPVALVVAFVWHFKRH